MGTSLTINTISDSRRLFASEIDFPTITACPLYYHDTFLNNPSVDANAQIASLEDHFVQINFNKTYYTAANSSGLVSRVVYPNAQSSLPNSCVRVTPQAPMTPGLHNPVSQFWPRFHMTQKITIVPW